MLHDLQLRGQDRWLRAGHSRAVVCARSYLPGGRPMAEEDAIWHVVVDGAQQGPLTKAEVSELLGGGTLIGSDLIWRPGFSAWRSVSEVNEFWRPPPPPMPGTAPPPIPTAARGALADERRNADEPSVGQKWSLWKSATIGLLFSAFTLLLQVANDGGFELANYAHTRSAATISGLMGQTLAVPLIFVLVALVRNLFNRRQPRSSASAVKWALTFAALLAGVFAAFFVYGEILFSSTEAVSGVARKKLVADFQRGCVQKQRSISPAATDAQVQSYCACVGEKFFDGMTYKQLGTDPDASALADLRQKTEAAANGCR